MPIFNPTTPSGNMTINPLTLAFTHQHRHLEKNFARNYFDKNLFHMRLSHWLTIFFYSIPGILDAVFLLT